MPCIHDIADIVRIRYITSGIGVWREAAAAPVALTKIGDQAIIIDDLAKIVPSWVINLIALDHPNVLAIVGREASVTYPAEGLTSHVHTHFIAASLSDWRLIHTMSNSR